MVSQSTWFRFATSEGTVIGEVSVPRRCPDWFKSVLKTMNDGANRAITMEDISAEEWVEECFSASRPIVLGRPLAPQRQEELVFFGPGRIAEFKKAIKALKDEGKTDKEVHDLIHNPTWIREFCYFMEDLERLPADIRGRLTPVPRKQVQPEHKCREFTVYVPMAQEDGSVHDDKNSFRLVPARVNHFTVLKTSHEFMGQVKNAYEDEIPVVGGQPAVVPAPA